MRFLGHLLIALGLVFALTVPASAAADAAKKAKKGKAVRGVVEAVDKDSLTVKVQAKKAKGGQPPTGEAVEKKFKLAPTTEYKHVVRVKGQKGQQESKEAKHEDVKKGGAVLVTAKDDTATQVSIMGRAKKKAK